MELEKTGVDKGTLFAQVTEILKSEGIVLKTIADLNEVSQPTS